MGRGARWVAWAFVGIGVMACGDDDAGTPSDAGGVDAPLVCRSDEACDDGVFCNGAERCDPSEPASSALGCVAGAAPCSASECDEVARSCSSCPDADGDGATDIACGGDDCDDSDPTRAPGLAEVCDAIGFDEDCDDTTFGDLDNDRDGHVSAMCCNGDRCGDDCDDANPGVHPTEAESCDGTDNDCDGAVDEGVVPTWYVDRDNDGFGDDSEPGMTQCVRPSGRVDQPGDCDDGDRDLFPGAPELCDDLRNDCTDGVVDEGCPLALGSAGASSTLVTLLEEPYPPSGATVGSETRVCPDEMAAVGYVGFVDGHEPNECSDFEGRNFVVSLTPLCATVDLVPTMEAGNRVFDTSWTVGDEAPLLLHGDDFDAESAQLCLGDPRSPRRQVCPEGMVVIGVRYNDSRSVTFGGSAPVPDHQVLLGAPSPVCASLRVRGNPRDGFTMEETETFVPALDPAEDQRCEFGLTPGFEAETYDRAGATLWHNNWTLSCRDYGIVPR